MLCGSSNLGGNETCHPPRSSYIKCFDVFKLYRRDIEAIEMVDKLRKLKDPRIRAMILQIIWMGGSVGRG